MKRVQSNIVNVGFSIFNKPGTDSKDRKLKTQGLEVNQAIVNGVNAGVTIRTVNGGQKSAAITLDPAALSDLLEAVSEVLAVGADATEGQ